MLAQPAILLSPAPTFPMAPMFNPFPITFALSAVATVVFGVELAIARMRIHPRTWLYVLLAGCVVLGAALMAWSGYYALYGPYEVDWRVYFTPPMPNPWFALYEVALIVNIAIVLLTIIGVIVTGRVMQKQKA